MNKRVALLAAAIALAAAVPAEAQDRSRAGRCVDGRYHRYGVNFPIGTDWPTFRTALFFENRNGFFLAILFDEDSEVVVSSVTNGRLHRSRFLYMAANGIWARPRDEIEQRSTRGWPARRRDAHGFRVREDSGALDRHGRTTHGARDTVDGWSVRLTYDDSPGRRSSWDR